MSDHMKKIGEYVFSKALQNKMETLETMPEGETIDQVVCLRKIDMLPELEYPQGVHTVVCAECGADCIASERTKMLVDAGIKVVCGLCASQQLNLHEEESSVVLPQEIMDALSPKKNDDKVN